MKSSDRFRITSTCTFGLESVLKREIRRLGYEIVSSKEGAVTISGTAEDIYALNLWLRCANRVLIEVAEAKAESFDALFDFASDIQWEYYLPKTALCNVSKITTVKSNLFSKSDCQRIIKKAVAERMKKAYKLSHMPENGAEYPLFVSIKDDIASIYLNTSGPSLHRRGYRLSKGEAPLKETLAAGMVYLANYKGQREFADFMCGSGTIAIEAAMIAANLPPGANREFSFDKWDILSAQRKTEILSDTASKRYSIENRILASDIDASAVKSARQNAERAGAGNFISFQRLDFRQFRSRKKNGLIVTNPPYAERLGDYKKIEQLYASIKNVYDSLDSWDMFVLCAHPEFQKAFGRKADKNRKIFNGDMLAYIYEYFAKSENNT